MRVQWAIVLMPRQAQPMTTVVTYTEGYAQGGCMKRLAAFVIAMAFAWAAGVCIAADGPPGWAYGFPPGPAAPNPPAAPAPTSPVDTSVKHLAGSNGAFTIQQIRDAFGPADWYPGDHPPMPDVVAHGRRPDVRACALCHYPNGKGRPENAPIAGYPAAYFIQQMMDFKDGDRKSAEPRKANTNVMIAIAKAMTGDEIKAAAEYYSSMKWSPWIRVVETKMAPKTRIAGGMFLTLEGEEKEPLGPRIIETPENTEATELLRNPRSGFIAYVPAGSIKRGELLVTKGGGKTMECGTCHGADLRGLGPVPGIAGRSPSYLVRQMYDMQQGARKGMWTDLMKPVVSKLTEDDMLAIAAYTASRMP
jgi:cytochrome c553